jgi:maleate cis-trans isomerase
MTIRSGCDASILRTTTLDVVSFGCDSETVLGWGEQHPRPKLKAKLTILREKVVDDCEDVR